MPGQVQGDGVRGEHVLELLLVGDVVVALAHREVGHEHAGQVPRGAQRLLELGERPRGPPGDLLLVRGGVREDHAHPVDVLEPHLLADPLRAQLPGARSQRVSWLPGTAAIRSRRPVGTASSNAWYSASMPCSVTSPPWITRVGIEWHRWPRTRPAAGPWSPRSRDPRGCRRRTRVGPGSSAGAVGAVGAVDARGRRARPVRRSARAAGSHRSTGRAVEGGTAGEAWS